MAVPILGGRGFNESDTAHAPRVAVVNEVLARHYWPNQSAIGKRLRLNDDKDREMEIVGVARASTYTRLVKARPSICTYPWRRTYTRA